MRRHLATLCGLLAALALFAIMVLTLVDVSGRKLLSASVPGSLELTELLMVVVIFAGLPLVSLAGEHVVFDSLDRWLPPAVRRLQQALVDLLCMGALGGGKDPSCAAAGDVSRQHYLESVRRRHLALRVAARDRPRFCRLVRHPGARP